MGFVYITFDSVSVVISCLLFSVLFVSFPFRKSVTVLGDACLFKQYRILIDLNDTKDRSVKRRCEARGRWEVNPKFWGVDMLVYICIYLHTTLPFTLQDRRPRYKSRWEKGHQASM